MIAACPGDRAARDADGQYLLGRDLLVAPVTAADGEQDVYLPAGGDGRWIGYETRTSHPGGGWLRLTRPPAQAPFFVRRGALLPVDPAPAAGAANGPEALTLEVWGAAGGETTVRDERGATRVRVSVSGGTAEVSTEGPLALARLEWPRIAGEPEPRRVLVDGRPWALDGTGPDRLVAEPGAD